MEEQPKRRGRPLKVEPKKTEDISKYNREYKKMQYDRDADKCKRLRNFYNYKNQYVIAQQWVEKYHEDVTLAISLKELQNKMGKELFSRILEDLEEMDFPKREKKIDLEIK